MCQVLPRSEVIPSPGIKLGRASMHRVHHHQGPKRTKPNHVEAHWLWAKELRKWVGLEHYKVHTLRSLKSTQ
ncbi:uncharacterized protein J3R85_018118 [Psidium guajava]|nr:uncharacterized protein J3R85_018118 [Psidium guajava]